MSVKLRLICFAVFLAGWFTISAMMAKAADGPAASTPSVTVIRASKSEVIGRVPLSGTLIPRSEVLIYPHINGYAIEELTVDVGAMVKKGDPLALLSTRVLEVQVAQARAELSRAGAAIEQAQSAINTAKANQAQANAALSRSQQLRKSGTGTQASLDQSVSASQGANAQLESSLSGLAVSNAQRLQSKAQLDIAELNLQQATITSPVDGLISARSGQIGSIANAGGDPIFRIIENGVVEVEAEIIETALGQLKVGDLATLAIAGVGSVDGKIRLISPTVDPATRLGIVKITTQNQTNLRKGLFVSGWITAIQRESLTVPSSAVLTDISGTYVLTVADNNIIKKAAVTGGLIWKDKREILSGLEVGDIVVAKAGVFFADGDVINPVYADKATEVETPQ